MRAGRWAVVFGAVLLLGNTECSSGAAGGAPVTPRSVDTLATLRWNAIARLLVSRHRTSPPVASRLYALVSVAQHRTVEQSGDDPAFVRAAIARASALILASTYPTDAGFLDASVSDARLGRGGSPAGDVDVSAADALGRRVADSLLAWARTDGSDQIWSDTAPVGPGYWYSAERPPRPPMLPAWGRVRPWVMTSGSQFRPPPPNPFGSPAFRRALAEVRRFSDERTDAQLGIARFWADGPGTATPPGHWNLIAADMIERYGLGEAEAAHALALLNVAMMDAGIACWDAKFAYWLIRPSQADTAITTPIGLPNFPSYTSGHASFSGAASEVLGYLFPREAERLRGMAEEAAMSRVYGGIHYRFDSERGLEQGRAVAALAVSLDGRLRQEYRTR